MLQECSVANAQGRMCKTVEQFCKPSPDIPKQVNPPKGDDHLIIVISGERQPSSIIFVQPSSISFVWFEPSLLHSSRTFTSSTATATTTSPATAAETCQKAFQSSGKQMGENELEWMSNLEKCLNNSLHWDTVEYVKIDLFL